MISAKEAFEMSKTNYKEAVQSQLKAVESCIQEEIRKGEFKAYYRKQLSENAIDMIKKMGYKVEKNLTFSNDLYYVIGWWVNEGDNFQTEKLKKDTWLHWEL